MHGCTGRTGFDLFLCLECIRSLNKFIYISPSKRSYLKKRLLFSISKNEVFISMALFPPLLCNSLPIEILAQRKGWAPQTEGNPHKFPFPAKFWCWNSKAAQSAPEDLTCTLGTFHNLWWYLHRKFAFLKTVKQYQKNQACRQWALCTLYTGITRRSGDSKEYKCFCSWFLTSYD